jgi:hypothetical protein
VTQAGPDELGRVARVERQRGRELARLGAGQVAAADGASGVGHQVVQAAQGGRDLVHRPAQRRGSLTSATAVATVAPWPASRPAAAASPSALCHPQLPGRSMTPPRSSSAAS